MTLGVRSRVLGVLLAAATLGGCGGPGESPAPSSSSSASRSTPPPGGSNCADAGDISALADLGLVDALKKMPGTTTFAGYASLDEARVKKLNALWGVTVFVPVDAAFGSLDQTQVAQLADPAWQAAAVEYAIVAGTFLPEDFASGKAQAMPTFRAAGAVLSAGQSGGTTVINGTAKAICTALPFDGGLIYLTDRVLLPPS